MPDPAERKRTLRSHYRRVRGAPERSEILNADREILGRLMSLEEYRNARLLLTYVSEGSEPDTLQLMVRALAEGKAVACPRCSREAHTMSFHKINSLEDLEPGAYGINEPAAGTEEIQPEEMDGSLCIVPGLAFDSHGSRLGYGGGYYDRFLAGYCGISIGLCRQESLSADPLPRDDFDAAVDKVVTDREIISTVSSCSSSPELR